MKNDPTSDLTTLSDAELYRLSINAPTKKLKIAVKREMTSRAPKAERRNPRTQALNPRTKW